MGMPTACGTKFVGYAISEALSSLLEQLDPLQAEDVESAIAYCITQPKRVSVNEVLIRPTQQAN